jgi:mRNA-degrading endonuclease toxin of MazEF toxin-antitoxin module
LPKKETGLPKDSVVRLTEIVTFDKHHLDDCVGTLSFEYLLKVDDAIRGVLGV